MPQGPVVAVVRDLTSRGYNVQREAATLLARADDPTAAVDALVEAVPDDVLRITATTVRDAGLPNPSVSPGTDPGKPGDDAGASPPETKGSASGARSGKSNDGAGATGTAAGVESGDGGPSAGGTAASTVAAGTAPDDATAAATTAEAAAATDRAGGAGQDASNSRRSAAGREPVPPAIRGDVTGRSTGTGEYGQFVTLFRDRYERLSKLLRGRVNHRPTDALQKMPGGADAGIIGMVNDVRSTANGHWLIELEDTNGVFPCLVTKDRELANLVDEIICDEVIGVEGTLSDDAGILFVDDLYFPDVPRTHEPSTADRHVQAALVSDVHVGSQEFMADAWGRFTDWLHTEEAEHVEYLCIAGDMVEGVGVYPNQDEELDVIDIYEQYERFAEYLKAVPGDMEIVMIPGNHDAVRLAEPQPAFDEELRDIMSAHDATIVGNPSTVELEGVSILMYHGVSLDELAAELPDEKASYDEPHVSMSQLLKKRHVAPLYGNSHIRIAPEEKDYLVVDEVPDVFHAGHVHKFGVGTYRNVRVINSGCWQFQTDFQRSVNIQPDNGLAPILDLDTLDVTVRKFT